MLTNNWGRMLANEFGIRATSGMKGIAINGREEDYMAFGGQYGAFRNTRWEKSKFIIGTGTSKPKPSDYKLEAEIQSGYECSTLTRRVVEVSDKCSVEIIGIIINTNDVSLTVNEIGWIGSENDTSVFLFAREVFDTPITLAPGETKSFVLKLF